MAQPYHPWSKEQLTTLVTSWTMGQAAPEKRLLSGHGCCTEEGLPGPSHPDPSKDTSFLHSQAPGNLSTGTITGGRRRVSKETRNIFRFIPIWLKRGPQHRKISSRHQHPKSLTRIQTRCSVQKHPWGHINEKKIQNYGKVQFQFCEIFLEFRHRNGEKETHPDIKP